MYIVCEMKTAAEKLVDCFEKDMATKVKKSHSLPSILSKFDDPQNVNNRKQALLDIKSKKKYFTKNNLL